MNKYTLELDIAQSFLTHKNKQVDNNTLLVIVTAVTDFLRNLTKGSSGTQIELKSEYIWSELFSEKGDYPSIRIKTGIAVSVSVEFSHRQHYSYLTNYLNSHLKSLCKNASYQYSYTLTDVYKEQVLFKPPYYRRFYGLLFRPAIAGNSTC